MVFVDTTVALLPVGGRDSLRTESTTSGCENTFQVRIGNVGSKRSDFVFNEVIESTLSILEDGRFAGANDELLSAFKHYRHRRTKECLNDCLKAMESALKSVCVVRGWNYPPTATAKVLIGIVFERGLVPG